MNRKIIGWVIASMLWTALPAQAHDAGEVAADMAMTAQRFLATLSEAQRGDAVLAFEADARLGWFFVPDRFIKPPAKRTGLPIAKMSQQQRLLAHALLSASLSHTGYQQATTIMALESILHDLENKNPIRNPELYYVTIFGEPATDKTWGWRFEGHHLSVNFTLAEGQRFAVTPSFFGSNPGRVPGGPLAGMRVLAAEEDLARKLVMSLSDDQRRKAVLTDKAPDDILTGQERKANRGLFFPPQGIAFSDLNDEQRGMLLELIRVYAGKHRGEVVGQINQGAKIADTNTMYFAWAGSIEPGKGHYYRVQTDAYVFEYDNTQNNANHVHAAWRSFDGDFGLDLLGEHYEEHHRKP